jgi:hypothetical protein
VATRHAPHASRSRSTSRCSPRAIAGADYICPASASRPVSRPHSSTVVRGDILDVPNSHRDRAIYQTLLAGGRIDLTRRTRRHVFATGIPRRSPPAMRGPQPPSRECGRDRSSRRPSAGVLRVTTARVLRCTGGSACCPTTRMRDLRRRRAQARSQQVKDRN